MPNKNNWRRLPQRPCACGCGVMVALNYKRGHSRRRAVLLRLLAGVEKQGDCWLWTGATTGGYGVIGIADNRTTSVHRVAYQLLVGDIPADRHVDHLCRNRTCVNPRHLEAVDQSENNHRTRLTPDEHLALQGEEQWVLMTVAELVTLLGGAR